MASKLASYVTGYEDERFEQVVSKSFHCVICTNVFKDPVMCRYNEHLFCRACITIHLMNCQKCPICMEPLTVDTLIQAPRGVNNLLGELKIRCEFSHRGCRTLVLLRNLERHVADCGFAPVVCSNEGCQQEVNKQDLIFHEIAACNLRKGQCQSCNELGQEINAVKISLTAMNGELNKNVKKIEANLKAVEQNLVVHVQVVELVQEQLNRLEVSNRHVCREIVDTKKSLADITEQLERMRQQASHQVQAQQEEMKKGIAEAVDMDTQHKVVVAGGENGGHGLNSVEMFSLSSQTWIQLQPMRNRRSGASSTVYNNQVVVFGGRGSIGGIAKSIESLPTDAIHTDHSITWEKLTAELPGRLSGHCSVVYNGRLMVIGGYDADQRAYSDSITEISLIPSYTTELLATMLQSRRDHGVAVFGDKVVIVGGRSCFVDSVLSSVVIYDITKNECKELEPLPYPVRDMATVKWGNDNLIIIGGADSEYKPLNKVVIYNVKTQMSHMLSDMKYKRAGCVAAVVSDTVIVMGGEDESGNALKSVESFRFDRYAWHELPEMHEARYCATAVVC